MKRTLTWIAAAAGVAVAALALRTTIARYESIAKAALAVWNDPEVKKVRRRAVKKIEKAQKKAVKAMKKGA